MPIRKQVTAPNGSMPTFHVPNTLKVDLLRGVATVHVVSYIDEATYLAGGPLSWNWADAAIAKDSILDVEKALIETVDSPFFGGAVAADGTHTVDAARQRKAEEISVLCRNTIVSGFNSDALGETNFYGSDPEDQHNLSACVLDSTLPGNDASWTGAFKCTGADGIKTYKMHTAAQLQKVGRDGMAAIMSCLLRNEVKQAAIKSANSVESVNAVNWNDPAPVPPEVVPKEPT